MHIHAHMGKNALEAPGQFDTTAPNLDVVRLLGVTRTIACNAYSTTRIVPCCAHSCAVHASLCPSTQLNRGVMHSALTQRNRGVMHSASNANHTTQHIEAIEREPAGGIVSTGIQSRVLVSLFAILHSSEILFFMILVIQHFSRFRFSSTVFDQIATELTPSLHR